MPTKPPKSKKNHRPKLTVEPTPHWYAVDIPKVAAAPPAAPPPSVETLSTISARAASLHAADVDLFHQHQRAPDSISGDASFLHRVLHEGTLSDRLGALTLLVQGSPVHNVRALETLRGLAARGRGTGGRGDALRALRCIVDWWVGGGAPPRKLRWVCRHSCDFTLWYAEFFPASLMADTSANSHWIIQR